MNYSYHSLGVQSLATCPVFGDHLNILCLWATISFGATIVLVTVLNHIRVGQLPLGFWIAQQGALLGFIALIFVYAFKMDTLDRAHHSQPDSSQRSRE